MGRLLQEQRALNHLPRGNVGDAESLRQLHGIGEAEHVVSTLSVKLVAKHTVNVRENQVNRLLGKAVERRTGRNNASEKRVVVLDMRFLVRRIRVAKEHGRFFFPIDAVLKGRHTAELATIVCQQYGKEFAKGEAEGGQFLLEGGDFFSRLGG